MAFIRLVNRGTAAPKKSRADFLVQQQIIAQLELSALRSAEKSHYNQFCQKQAYRPRSEWHFGRRGRKAWPEGVAGSRGRKSWPEGVVGRRACRYRRIAARTFCVQFMTVALVIIEYPDEAWVLITDMRTRRRPKLASSQ